MRRQPARATVLAVCERADDRGFFFGFGLPANTAVDVANTSRSAASQCCLTVHAAMCGPHLIGAFANAVFQALVHVRRPSGLMMEPFLISHHN